jgi:predicted nucleotidyltransferase
VFARCSGSTRNAKIGYVTRLQQLRERQRQRIIELAARRGASNVRVFGSVARGDSKDTSDYDFLVDLAPDRSLMDLVGLLMDLQDLLQARVDVATESMLRPGAKENALRDAVPL